MAMQKMLSLVVVFAMLHTGPAWTEQQAPVIPQNTEVEIELLESVSSETLHDGQTVSFKIVRPVVENGATVMAAGVAVSGEVKSVKTSGAWHKAGAFDMVLKPVRLEDGSIVSLDFPRPKLRGTKKEKTTVAIAAPPILAYYFPVIPVLLIGAARKGKPFEIRAGERYLVYVVSSARAAESESQKTTEPAKP